MRELLEKDFVKAGVFDDASPRIYLGSLWIPPTPLREGDTSRLCYEKGLGSVSHSSRVSLSLSCTKRLREAGPIREIVIYERSEILFETRISSFSDRRLQKIGGGELLGHRWI